MTRSVTDAGAAEAPMDFRSFMAGFPTGVAVVTVLDGAGMPRGMTCSSVCSVTLAPPTLLVCMRLGSPTLEAVLQQRMFAVNLLHERAQPIAQLFGSGLADRFDHVRWRAEGAAAGPHLVDDAHAVADCRVSRADPVGDHMVVFGQVVRIWPRCAPEPLLYGLRRYASWPVA